MRECLVLLKESFFRSLFNFPLIIKQRIICPSTFMYMISLFRCSRYTGQDWWRSLWCKLLTWRSSGWFKWSSGLKTLLIPNSHDCTLALILESGWLRSSLSVSGFRDKQRTLANTVSSPGDVGSSTGKNRGGMPNIWPNNQTDHPTQVPKIQIQQRKGKGYTGIEPVSASWQEEVGPNETTANEVWACVSPLQLKSFNHLEINLM